MTELEEEGVAILKKYGMVVRMNRPLVAFLRKVADRMGWAEFKKLL